MVELKECSDDSRGSIVVGGRMVLLGRVRVAILRKKGLQLGRPFGIGTSSPRIILKNRI
jgi:hypothetical protein